MLKKEISFSFVFVIFVLLSCEQKSNWKAKDSTNLYVSKEFKPYTNVYNSINDSLQIFIDSLISSYSTEYSYEWQLDSLLCINSASDKLVTTTNISVGNCSDCLSDEVEKLLGKKINGNWYFFKAGESLTVPRDMYGKNGTDPLSFYELSQIARKEFLEGMLQKQPDGSYKINDQFIDYQFYNGYGGPEITKEQKDSIHWDLIRGQWKYRIDTNEYKPLRKNKYNS